MKLDKIHERQKALETQLSRMDSEMDTRMKKYLKTIKDWILKIEENNTKDSFNTDFIELLERLRSARRTLTSKIKEAIFNMLRETYKFLSINTNSKKPEKLKHLNKRTSYKAKVGKISRKDDKMEKKMEKKMNMKMNVKVVMKMEKEDGKNEGENRNGYEDQNDESEGDY
ncbi:hypothetical protein RCL_jg1336.t1 [Rhizophagus clarus]|uniref:Uncharacterized protein n=1 Tax=Rhizophagus clarus TaxID=94130 RepID=A0A8H3R7Q9_9GLOM|nr:hypothetical protein RCL_jg1336.t1 [Rhizophagus clarus]